MKRFVAASVTALLMLPLAGCGNSGPSADCQDKIADYTSLNSKVSDQRQRAADFREQANTTEFEGDVDRYLARAQEAQDRADSYADDAVQVEQYLYANCDIEDWGGLLVESSLE